MPSLAWRLITAKWSIRADREEQFVSDFTSYVRLERAGQSKASE